MTITERFAKTGTVPVVVLEREEDAVPTANALLAGGIDIMEITMRTPAALGSIRKVAESCPDMLVGAGTVTNMEQCRQALEAGAKFIVLPGLNTEVASFCIENGITVLPGCVTPTEIMMGLELGLKIFKFFPANIYGGLKAMKALSGPFGSVKFVPTGGVNGENLGEYLKAPYIHAVGGSWLCTAEDIREGNWDKITELAAQASAAVPK